MNFKVGKYAGVGEKMRTLANLAVLAGIRQIYLNALMRMYRSLEHDPLGCGDPLYRLQVEGGMVCHAVFDPIIVRYSVHEPENAVLIMDIAPLFEWPIRP